MTEHACTHATRNRGKGISENVFELTQDDTLHHNYRDGTKSQQSVFVTFTWKLYKVHLKSEYLWEEKN